MHSAHDPLDEALGHIAWKTGWRRYVFYPRKHTCFDASCMQEIILKINELMAQRKEKTSERA